LVRNIFFPLTAQVKQFLTEINQLDDSDYQTVISEFDIEQPRAGTPTEEVSLPKITPWSSPRPSISGSVLSSGSLKKKRLDFGAEPRRERSLGSKSMRSSLSMSRIEEMPSELPIELFFPFSFNLYLPLLEDEGN